MAPLTHSWNNTRRQMAVHMWLLELRRASRFVDTAQEIGCRKSMEDVSRLNSWHADLRRRGRGSAAQRFLGRSFWGVTGGWNRREGRSAGADR